MDKNYYYRLLGVRSDATESQIKKAYEERMRKLRLPDYGDDPDYVAKKISEIKYAYSVVMGSAAPITKAQIESRFEDEKDILDGGEGAEERRERRQSRSRDRSDRESRLGHISGRTSSGQKKTVINLSQSLGRAKETYSQYTGKLNGNLKKKGLATIIAIITIMISLIGSCTSKLIDSNDYYDFDQTGGYDYDTYTAEAVDMIYKINSQYDFYSYLELDPNASQAFDYTYDDDELRNEAWILCEALEIYDLAGALTYITKDDRAYDYYDGYQMADIITNIMMPPTPEELYGAKNLIRESTIENYYDYMLFLEDIAWMQTGDLKNGGA